MKYFFYALIPLVVLVAVMYVVIDSIYQNEAKVEAEQRSRTVANEASVELNYLLRPLVASNIYLARSNSLKNLLVQAEEGEDVLGDFALLAKTHPVFQQVRLLDTSGMEVLRVNYDDEGVELISPEELQDKSHRDYLITAKELGRNQIYITPIGLNIEHGEVELPYKGVMRIISPVYDKQNHYLGYLIFNVSVERLLSLLDVTMKVKHERLLLINYSGEGVIYQDGRIAYYFEESSLGSFSSTDSLLKINLMIGEEGIINLDKGTYSWKEIDLRSTDEFGDEISLFEPEKANFKVVAFARLESSALLTYIDTVDRLLLIGLILSFLVLAHTLALGRNQLEKRHKLISELNDELIKSQAQLNQEKRSLKGAVHELSHRNKQLKEFSNIISHNVRAPLSSLSLLVSYLMNNQNEMTPDDRQEGLMKLKDSSDTLNLLAEDLRQTVEVLDREEVAVGKVNLYQVMLNVTEVLADKVAQNNVEIQTNFENWETLLFNQEYLEGILINLVNNAIKYRNPKSPLIVNLITDSVKGKKVLKVMDNGQGINLKWHGNGIFGMHRTFHRDIAGRGMGLFMVKLQLEALGASIFVESKEGVGTNFTIIF